MPYEGPTFSSAYGRRILGKGSVRRIKGGKGKGKWRVRIRVPSGHNRMGLRVYKTLYVQDFNTESEANHAYEHVTREMFPSSMKFEVERKIQESRALYEAAKAAPNMVKRLILKCRAFWAGF